MFLFETQEKEEKNATGYLERKNMMSLCPPCQPRRLGGEISTKYEKNSEYLKRGSLKKKKNKTHSKRRKRRREDRRSIVLSTSQTPTPSCRPAKEDEEEEKKKGTLREEKETFTLFYKPRMLEEKGINFLHACEGISTEHIYRQTTYRHIYANRSVRIHRRVSVHLRMHACRETTQEEPYPKIHRYTTHTDVNQVSLRRRLRRYKYIRTVLF